MAGKSKFKRRVLEEFTEHAGVRDGVNLRKLKMNVEAHDVVTRVQKISFGPLDNNRETKVILLVGQTGTGKSTLINAMTNYIFCTDFEDDYRLILVDEHMNRKSKAESQTDMITAYQFSYVEGMPFEYNYILIDTPGFGDTRGIKEDEKLMKQLDMFFHKNYGFDHVNGVGFAIQSPAIRLASEQKYIYEGLLSMFGKNIEDNIFIMATWASAELPKILDGVKEAGIKYKHCYQFDNYALYVDKTPKVSPACIEEAEDEAEAIEEHGMCYKKVQKNLRRFFTQLSSVSSSSLVQTKNVLENRNKLKVVVEELQRKIQVGLATMSRLQDQRNSMKQSESNLEAYRDYEFEIVVEKVVTKTKSYGDALGDVYRDKDGELVGARVTAGAINPFIAVGSLFGALFTMGETREVKKTKEKRINQEMYKKFNETNDKIKSKKSEIKKIENEIQSIGIDVLNTIEEAHAYVQKLEREALKPQQTSILEYINTLIASEMNQMQIGYQNRVSNLEKLKNLYSLLLKVREKPTNLGNHGEDIILAVQKWMKN